MPKATFGIARMASRAKHERFTIDQNGTTHRTFSGVAMRRIAW
jgi:hypothetical protein